MYRQLLIAFALDESSTLELHDHTTNQFVCPLLCLIASESLACQDYMNRNHGNQYLHFVFISFLSGNTCFKMLLSCVHNPWWFAVGRPAYLSYLLAHHVLRSSWAPMRSTWLVSLWTTKSSLTRWGCLKSGSLKLMTKNSKQNHWEDVSKLKTPHYLLERFVLVEKVRFSESYFKRIPTLRLEHDLQWDDVISGSSQVCKNVCLFTVTAKRLNQKAYILHISGRSRYVSS